MRAEFAALKLSLSQTSSFDESLDPIWLAYYVIGGEYIILDSNLYVWFTLNLLLYRQNGSRWRYLGAYSNEDVQVSNSCSLTFVEGLGYSLISPRFASVLTHLP